MSEFLGSVWWLLVSLGILVTIHEFGHFWVARRCGVKVLRFSIGFGGALWKRIARDGTEYRFAAIPLGGYVKMLDERETDVAPAEAAQAFNRQNVWKRIAIVAAGPAANLLLCFALLWLMFVVGRPDYAPVIGQATGIAAESGLRADDRVIAVDGRDTPTWMELQMALLPGALDRADVPLRVVDVQGHERQVQLGLSALPEDF
ncbi:MAG TPA: RIP metalloprotease RseP, partial [Luteimonas sp.]|nr:RIP metalloprotease RseP [Luteimonas sp.]